MKKMSQRGFTLVELMLVVIILGVLATMAVVKFTGRAQEAKVQTAKGEIAGAYATALQLYEIDTGKYPGEEGLTALKSSSAKGWKGPYIKTKSFNDPWGNPYQYKCPGTHNQDDYDLYSFGPDGQEGGGDDITNWSEEN
ncbi:MAG: type II secretion system major pseudopilin GspG [Candidatus Auribacterota bacterium]|jgi:general secretion pathway protein G|uniref:Type II secretion system core protein G n=1 Tax=Candidatus Auribacter fodinae TaxID=2093366 RepID=A0A3A4QVY1_9BACT|nr:MAG: type II secretion system protein GspG [Candidatus Auribacter fodinae]